MNKKTVIAYAFLLVLIIVGAVYLMNKKADAPQPSVSTREEKRKEEVLNHILNDEKTMKMLEEQGVDPDSLYLENGKYIKISEVPE